MKRNLVLCLLVILLAVASLTAAQTSGYTLTWWTVDGGGGLSGNDRYSLQATIGQPDAGEMGNSPYALLSGYWDGLDQYDVYLPLVIRP